uniref:Uncharacterized protein n=1 Tax=Arundo donax TaxID=35708 RepID=A0A0A9FT76_ARUDO
MMDSPKMLELVMSFLWMVEWLGLR